MSGFFIQGAGEDTEDLAVLAVEFYAGAVCEHSIFSNTVSQKGFLDLLGLPKEICGLFRSAQKFCKLCSMLKAVNIE